MYIPACTLFIKSVDLIIYENQPGSLANSPKPITKTVSERLLSKGLVNYFNSLCFVVQG